jgi:hypothetical protein
MSRNRWIEIKNNLHCNDNANYNPNDTGRDRLFKIRPLVDNLKEKFKIIPMEQHLCVDEQIVPYKVNQDFDSTIQKNQKNGGIKFLLYVTQKGLYMILISIVERLNQFLDSLILEQVQTLF